MRYKAIISYDGSNYSGYQKQLNGDSIQDRVEKALRLMTMIDIPTFAASRTDKGVHAMYQVLHFDSEINLESNEPIQASPAANNSELIEKYNQNILDSLDDYYASKKKLKKDS